MQKSRIGLLITLVLVSVAVVIAWPSSRAHASPTQWSVDYGWADARVGETPEVGDPDVGEPGPHDPQKAAVPSGTGSTPHAVSAVPSDLIRWAMIFWATRFSGRWF